jgi:hypothetical protein
MDVLILAQIRHRLAKLSLFAVKTAEESKSVDQLVS